MIQRILLGLFIVTLPAAASVQAQENYLPSSFIFTSTA
jgi:hypothetical protein